MRACAALPRYYGPVALRQLPGKGRGLVALTDMEVGDLVLVVLPTGVVYEHEGDAADEPPPVEALAEQLLHGALTPAQQQLLRLAFDGTDGTTACCPDLPSLHNALSELDARSAAAAPLPPSSTPAPIFRCTAVGGSAFDEDPGPCDASCVGGPLEEARDTTVHRVVHLNCFAEPRMDPAVLLPSVLGGMRRQGTPADGEAGSGAQRAGVAGLDVAGLDAAAFLRLAAADGEEGHGALQAAGAGHAPVLSDRWLHRPGHTGLWVEHAWMNHSCAPNVVSYVLGESMVVRASQPIAAGEEVCGSYLGGLLAAPAQLRQGELWNHYGFVCGCPRCEAEEQLPPRTRARLHAAWDALQRVLPTAMQLMQHAAEEAAAPPRKTPVAAAAGVGGQHMGADECIHDGVLIFDGPDAPLWPPFVQEAGAEGAGGADEAGAEHGAEAAAAAAWVGGVLDAALGDEVLGGRSAEPPLLPARAGPSARRLARLAVALDRLVAEIEADLAWASSSHGPGHSHGHGEHRHSHSHGNSNGNGDGNGNGHADGGELEADWAAFTVSGLLDLSLVCRRVAAATAAAAAADDMDDALLEAWHTARSQRLQRLVQLAGEVVSGSAYHVDVATEFFHEQLVTGSGSACSVGGGGGGNRGGGGGGGALDTVDMITGGGGGGGCSRDGAQLAAKSVRLLEAALKARYGRLVPPLRAGAPGAGAATAPTDAERRARSAAKAELLWLMAKVWKEE